MGAGRDMRARGGIVDEHHVHVAAEQALNRGARTARWPKARTPKRRDVPIAPRAPQQKKARRSCGRKHTSAPAFIIKLLIRTRRGVFRDV
jgi:sRNA-binding protein